jgi:PAS domain S-box-containing protein
MALSADGDDGAPDAAPAAGEAPHRVYFERSPVAILVADGSGRFVDANPAACELTGYSRAELLERGIGDLGPPGGTVGRDLFRRAVAQGRSGGELRLRRRDGSIRWVAAEGARLEVDRFAAFLRDVTARREVEEALRLSEARLRTLASEASLAEERERRHVATEVHDRIAQPLAMAKLQLQALLPRVADPAIAGPLGDVCGLLDGALGDTRSLTFEISSPILYDLGLEPALEWLADQLHARHGIACTFDDDGAPKPLADDLRVVLYQAVRELCTNIVKHAGARAAQIAVRRVDDTVRVEVSDDGGGFPAEVTDGRPLATRGFGLFSVRERLHHLGAVLQIESTPGRGSRVTLVAPLLRDSPPET